jgi:hypothetical protein
MNPYLHPDFQPLLEALKRCEKRLPRDFRGPWPKPEVHRVMWGLCFTVHSPVDADYVGMQFSGMTMKYAMDMREDDHDPAFKPLKPPYPELKRKIAINDEGDLTVTYYSLIPYAAGGLGIPPEIAGAERMASRYTG